MGKIKLLSNYIDKQKELSDFLSKTEGVTLLTVKSDIVTYELDEWASDYDVLVELINKLEEKGVDSVPLDDDGIIVDQTNSLESEGNDFDHKSVHSDHLSVNSDKNCENTCNNNEHCDHLEDCDHTCHNHNNEHNCSHNHSHNSLKCCSEDEDKTPEEIKKERIFKGVELLIAIAVLVVGVILNNIPSGVKFAPYVQVVAYAIAGYEVIFSCVNKFFKKQFFNEELLMTIASLSAILLGEVIEATGIMILYVIGEMFSNTAVDNATKVIDSLKNLRPDKVNLIVEGGTKRVRPEEIKVGDVILVKAGDKIALDGVVIEGTSSVDVKALTGESSLKVIEVDNEVFGGSVNVDGVLKIKVTKDYQNSSLSKIMNIVETSQEKKSKAEKFITKFAKWYTPLVMALAILIAFIPPFFTASYGAGLILWGKRAVMLLCISCPCALVVSVPLTYYLGVATAATKGVIVKYSEYLEKLADCDTIAFDKTGTLTKGEFTITKIMASKNFKGEVLKYASIAETLSNHPLAKAINKQSKEKIEQDKLINYQEIAGRGISVEYKGDKILCGNYKLMVENNVEVLECNELGMKLYVAVNGKYAGVIVLNDEIKDKSYGAILELYDAGILNTVMLTGDNKEYAVKIRKELQMKQSVSELLPEGKVKELELLMEGTKGTVAYVGDGINDAPVITRADIGFSMGALGSDIAINAADIVLTDDDLSKVPFTVKLAKRTKVIAKQNIIASIGIKAIIMLLSIFGISTSLWIAIGADVGVMILAILNALRNRGKIY